MRGNMITVCGTHGLDDNGNLITLYIFSFDHYKTFGKVIIAELNTSDNTHDVDEDRPNSNFILTQSGPFAGYKNYAAKNKMGGAQ
jgi:hypothetical protein